MPKDEIQEDIVDAWRTYLVALEKSIEKLEREIKESSEMAGACTDEWCQATQHYIDDINNALFSISEPRWTNNEDSDKIKALKRRVHDLYADYREVYREVAKAG
jgi:hypothetical protein